MLSIHKNPDHKIGKAKESSRLPNELISYDLGEIPPYTDFDSRRVALVGRMFEGKVKTGWETRVQE